VTGAPAHADEVCVLHATAPSRVAVNSGTLSIPFRLVDLSACPYTFDVTADAGGTRTQDFLHYTNSATTDSITYLTGFDHPGSYTVGIVSAASSAHDAEDVPVPIQFSADTTVVKFATQAYIASERHGSDVYINALIHQYGDFGPGVGAGRAVYLQRYLPTGWQTMLMRTANASGKIVVGFVQRAVYQYRVVAAEDSSHFGGYSASAFR
jgi:hypothetical protein